MVETVSSFGGVDVLFSNAGIQPPETYTNVEDTSEEMWDRILGVNLKSRFLMAKYAIPEMIRAGGGAILNVGSHLGLVAGRRNASYAAFKAALIHLIRQMAVDYGADGVRVNALCPARIVTEDKQKMLDANSDEVRRQKLVYPLGRPGTMGEAAQAALFMVSDESSFITGHALVVDGGNSMGQIGAAFAMGQAIERARTHQVALAAVRGSNHCGAMAYYPMLALSEDMIGVAATNALPTMAPWGGVEKILGINPLAVAIPAGEERPIVYDAAFSGSSHGKLRVYDQKGLEIPEDWAFDRDGRPTTDAGRALEGLLQPIVAYKGTGLALVMGVFSALLSGAASGTELGDMVAAPRAGEDGHVFMALRSAPFQ